MLRVTLPHKKQLNFSASKRRAFWQCPTDCLLVTRQPSGYSYLEAAHNQHPSNL